MKKISKLAISIPSTVIAVTGVTAGITSCGKDEPQSKTDIKNVLTNTVVIDENVTNNVNSLNGNQILNLLGGRNPNLKTEHLKFSLNTPPYRDETMTNDINFWYLTIDTSDSEFYESTNVTINVINKQISLSDYVRNTVLGTLEVQINGATDANGPKVEDIRNKLNERNVNIDDNFIKDLTINNATRVGDETNLYEYQSIIQCGTSMLQKYPFIKFDDNTLIVNFYGIEDGYAAYKLGNKWDDSFSTYIGKEIEGRDVDIEGSNIEDGHIDVSPNTDNQIIRIQDLIDDGFGVTPIDYAVAVKGRNTYDTIICLQKKWPIKQDGNPVSVWLHRYTNYEGNKLDLSGLALDPIPAPDPDDGSQNPPISIIYGNKSSILILGNLLPENVLFHRNLSNLPDEDKELNIYSNAMKGEATIQSNRSASHFMNPVVNLHLPYGSNYSLNLTNYTSDFTYFGVNYGPSDDRIHAPRLNVYYDYNGNIPE